MAALRGLVLLVILAVLGASAPAAATSVERPAWTVGDYWTYESNTTVIPGLELTGAATSTVFGTYPVTSGGQTVDAVRVVLTGSGTAAGTVNTSYGPITVQGSWILTGEERLEPTNLHPLYSLLDLQVNGTYAGALPFTLRFQNTTTYQVVTDGWPYPMVVGAAGNLTANYDFTQDLYSSVLGNFHENGTGKAEFGFALSAAVSVVTPAGTFQAYPLREDAPDGTWQRLFFSPAAGNDVRMETHDRNGNLTAVSTLVSYRYQAAEPPTYLGLTLVGWSVAAASAAVIVIVLALVRRRARRKKSRPQPGETESEDSTSGPRGP